MHLWNLQVEVILCETTFGAGKEGSENIRKVGLSKYSGVANNIWLFQWSCIYRIELCCTLPEFKLGLIQNLKLITATCVMSTCATANISLFASTD